MNLSLSIGKFVLTLGRSLNPAQWLRGDDSGSGEGATLRDAYQQSCWVYACADIIARQVAQIPFVFSATRGGEDRVETGPLVELFEHPHPYLSRSEFWKLLTLHLNLRGRAYVVALDGAGQPINLTTNTRPMQLALLNPDQMQPVMRGRELAGWRYTGATDAPIDAQVLLPEELAYLRFVHPFSFYDGLAPLTVAMLAAQTDYASAQFMKGLMLNNADTGVIVTTEQQLLEEQRVQMVAALNERKRRAGTADRPLFLFGGAKVEKPTLSSTDMQFLENRKFNRQEICAVFGVPQELLGFTEDANRSVGESARYNFVENRIAPLCTEIADGLQGIVRLASGGRRASTITGWFDVDSLPIMQAARRERFTGAVTGFSIGVPINELNKIFDLGLSDDLPHGDKSYLPFSMQEVGAATTPAESNEETDPALMGVRELRGLLTAKAETVPAHQCGPSSGAYEASIKGSEKLKRAMLRNFFTAQQGRVLGALESQISNLKSQIGVETKAEFDSQVLFDLLDAENEKLLKKFTPLLKGDLQFGGSQLWAELGLVDDFNVPPQKAIEFLAKRQNEIKGINTTTFNKIRDSLQDGLREGDGLEALTQRVKEVFTQASDLRAEVIASTETNIAVNTGRFEGMKEAGVEKKGWQSSNLINVRPSHQQASGQEIGIDEKFSVGGAELSYPGDPEGPPGETINCRCFTYAVLPGKAASAPRQFLGYHEWQGRTIR